MSLIKVTAEELEQVSGQLGASAAAINDENSKALGMVNGLVGAGWEGAASSQFHTLFTEWKTGADQVQHALHGISTLLNKAGAAYASTEDQIRSAMQ